MVKYLRVDKTPTVVTSESIKDILMRRDKMTEREAIALIEKAREDLANGLANGDPDYDICEKWFGLEPDYIYELMDGLS